MSHADSVEKLQAQKATHRNKPPTRLSMSLTVEPRESFSFPEEEKKVRKDARKAKVSCLIHHLLSLCVFLQVITHFVSFQVAQTEAVAKAMRSDGKAILQKFKLLGNSSDQSVSYLSITLYINIQHILICIVRSTQLIQIFHEGKVQS